MIGGVVLDPLLWESLEAGGDARVEFWLASEGDRVRAGQPIAWVWLLHCSLELRAPHEGVLESILVSAGDRFADGAVLAQVVPFWRAEQARAMAAVRPGRPQAAAWAYHCRHSISRPRTTR
jgi:pyruvate/2-oxoglutarate dehydrogenase complex dihydrolipoamide acyltransferase (E2) component